MIPIHLEKEGFTLPVKVTPRSGKNGIQRFQNKGVTVQIHTSAIPENGKANEAVIMLLKKALALPLQAIERIQSATFSYSH